MMAALFGVHWVGLICGFLQNRSSTLLQCLVPIAVSLQRCWGDAQRYGVAAGVLAANRGCCCCMELLMVLGRMMLVF
ncbi:unnamed protein product [Camellia sinensis]